MTGGEHSGRDSGYRKRIAALIPSWNRRVVLERCVASLLRQEVPEWAELEVAVLDDGSTDGTAEWLRGKSRMDPRVRGYRFERSRGPGVCRNALLRATESDYVVLMDSDAYVQTPDGLARLADSLGRRPDLVAVSGIIYSDAGHERPPFFCAGYMTRNLHGDLPRWRTETENPQFLSSCFSLWRRQPIVETGGYDPFYGHGIEDVDVTLRLAARGWGFGVLREVAAVHEMVAEGRRRPFDDFDRVFRYLEWTRPYMHIKLYGWRRTAAAAVRWLRRTKEFEAHYGLRLGARRRLLCQALFPAIHLAAWPGYRLFWWRRDFILRAPVPVRIE